MRSAKRKESPRTVALKTRKTFCSNPFFSIRGLDVESKSPRILQNTALPKANASAAKVANMSIFMAYRGAALQMMVRGWTVGVGVLQVGDVVEACVAKFQSLASSQHFSHWPCRNISVIGLVLTVRL